MVVIGLSNNGNNGNKVIIKKYKIPKSIDGQIEYLADKKNVIYEELPIEEYKSVLHRRNYINLITPFKHCFSKVEDNNEYKSVRNEDGNHIYEKKTDLFEYFLEYENERDKYPTYYDGILKFETAFKSIVGHHFLIKYNVINSARAEFGFDTLLKNIDSLKIDSLGNESDIRLRKKQMRSSINNLKRKLHDEAKEFDIILGKNIYILLDRMGLTDTLNLYLTLPSLDQKKIFNFMNSLGLELGAVDHKEFGKKVFNLVSIRNNVMHFNSVTILLKYTDDTKKELRSRESRNKYEKIMKALEFISHNCEV